MKKLILILVSFILIVAFIIGGTVGTVIKFKATAHSEEKFFLPKVTLRDLKDNKIKFDKINKSTILLFWLPQSKSCQQQFENLKILKEEYNDNLNILAINIGQIDREVMEKINIELQEDIPIVIDDKAELTEQLQITNIPTLVFYNPAKKAKTIIGLKEEKELKKLIKNYFPTLTVK
ncbi:thioredoxin-like protein [Orenia metallireducens]|jgi:thioredoxin-like negative regulator of GroEL|uniref:Thioredoxin-like n=1 Tax=Orenia metallireducens TaxID=1413210 RepID=A0A285GBX2_9FIRM|nr:thioredoxin-like domain-containing protein [Orenia metallireducens]PRX32531.1 thioredoxin-like protein [Orenia metallireducens]SNY20955.1 Thioredoxin-like [Orenia metallireducens]